MKTKTKTTPKPLSPGGKKLLEILREIYAPIDWASDEIEEAQPTPMPI
ncbi:MAG: hypothetical protein WCL19_11035 [Verrucomicrobiota bacterium]